MEKPGALRRQRLLAGVTLTELSRQLGVSPSFVSNAERGLIKLTPMHRDRYKAAISFLLDPLKRPALPLMGEEVSDANNLKT
jgi:transcriptional regulator with XRE-family HTH domain